MEELQRRGVRPRRLVATGLRVYTLELGGRNQRSVVAKDSLNFFGCALSKLPAMFGLDGVPDKPFFPYNYIRAENMDVAHVGLPPAADYDPDRMRPAERDAFQRWHAEEQQRRPNRLFVLRRELLRYCANDVRILRRACLRFRHVVGELSGGVEPFLAASTIAGLALAIYRQQHLPRDLMVHTPEGGFLRGRRASAASRHFFALLERLRPQWRGRLRTARWSIGEACVEDDGYRLDALLYRPVPLRPLVIEFNGCFFHGKEGGGAPFPALFPFASSKVAPSATRGAIKCWRAAKPPSRCVPGHGSVPGSWSSTTASRCARCGSAPSSGGCAASPPECGACTRMCAGRCPARWTCAGTRCSAAEWSRSRSTTRAQSERKLTHWTL